MGCVEAPALRLWLRRRRRRRRGFRKGIAGVHSRCVRCAGVVHLAFPWLFTGAPLLLLASAVSLPCCARGCDTSTPLQELPRRCEFLEALAYWRARARHKRGPLLVGANSQWGLPLSVSMAVPRGWNFDAHGAEGRGVPVRCHTRRIAVSLRVALCRVLAALPVTKIVASRWRGVARRVHCRVKSTFHHIT